MQLGCTAAISIHRFTYSINNSCIHNRRHQLLILNQTYTHAVGLTAAAVVDSHKHRNRPRLLTNNATNTAGTVLSEASYRLSQIANLVAALQIRHYSQHPHLIHKEITAAALHKRMSEGKQLTAVIRPGDSPQRAQIHISLHQCHTNAATWLKRLFAGSTHATCANSSQAKGRQLLLQIFQSVFRKATSHKCCSFRNPVRRNIARFIQKRQHLANRGQKAVMRVIEGFAKGYCSHKSAIHVYRAAAHSLSDTAGFFNQVAIQTDKNIITGRFITCYA